MMCFIYDDVAVCHSEKPVKCRKPHVCAGCSRVIQPGESALNSTGRFDGSWYSEYACENCERAVLSIVIRELAEGCRWDEAWCAWSDLAQTLHDGPLDAMLAGTIEQCREQVEQAHAAKRMAVVT